jgi:hypothetical protein
MKSLLACVLAAAACQPLDPAATADPASCEGCHPDQTREWASSMHAYASDDPVFVAMNQRGQRETGGQLGSFCVRCHQPTEARGVGCVACHQVAAIEATHNGGIVLDRDGPMRGALRAPERNPAHESQYSELVDGDQPGSSRMCGACHDVVLPNGLAIENTYAEWNASVFGGNLSCSGCHMFSAGPRRHDHSFPGIDVAATPWPGVAEQRALIARDLRPALLTKLCVQPTGGGVEVAVTLDNAQVGHAFPSGTTHARRVRAELTADGAVNPDVWVLRSRFRRGGEEVQFAWDADAIDSELLMPSTSLDPASPGFYHARTRTVRLVGRPEMIRLAITVQPIGTDILEDLVASGDLDPAVIAASSTHTLESATRVWRAADGFGCVP